MSETNHLSISACQSCGELYQHKSNCKYMKDLRSSVITIQPVKKSIDSSFTGGTIIEQLTELYEQYNDSMNRIQNLIADYKLKLK